MTFIKKEWLLVLILLAPFILIAYFWSVIPSQIPQHWNINGVADAWGSRSSLFIIPFVNLGLTLLVSVLPQLDPKKQIYALYPRGFRIVRLILAVILVVLFLFALSAAIRA